ncbi:unnamed protein product [Adineta ricciae]|nr:unnamed protein product [Adineta ricciae]
MLKNVQHIALTSDFWSTRQQESFVCITGHYVNNDMNFDSTALHFQSFKERHFAHNIAEEVNSCLREFDIHNKITTVACDGAANMKKAFDSYTNIDRLWCVAHRLHLSVCNGLGLWAKHTKKQSDSSQADPYADNSMDIQTPLYENGEVDDEDGANDDLIVDSWADDVITADSNDIGNNSNNNNKFQITTDNLATTVNKLPLTLAQKEKLSLFELTSNDWIIINELVHLLEPISNATEYLSGSKYPTIGLALFTLRSIKEFLEDDEDKTDVFIILKNYFLDTFKVYFNENDDQHHLLTFYGYFDPFGFSVLTTQEKAKIERLIKQKNKEQVQSTPARASSSSSASTFSTNQAMNINSQTTNEKPDKLTKFLKSINKCVPTDNRKHKTISEEIAYYASLCKQHPRMHAIPFWKQYGQELPMLKNMAKCYLATTSTSVPSESAFSSSAQVEQSHTRIPSDPMSDLVGSETWISWTF